MSAALAIAVALAVSGEAVSGEAPAVASRAGPAEPRVEITEIVMYGPVVPGRLRNPKTVALTFDDGPAAYTAEVLDVLYRNRVPATFCLLGDNAEEFPALARRIAREGHQICNHSRSHVDLARASARRVRMEVAIAQWQIARATGVKPETFRFPYGSSDRESRKTVARFGLRALGWDVDPQDWKRPPARAITSHVVRNVRSRDVVLMHDGGGDRSRTAASLEATIRELRRRGFRFVLA